ncbi:MAG: aminomethyl-transferring glycine dehydrogenase subunit GcvPB [Candidatus Omnitrophica bacterium]|nr:aminomethyl-transferring glycine dehydrogenase subunit GcvPB [Candidatus Omnitrophota bacterium]MBU1134627.1 aminomethyl-transferring glycine dehydrogenase subunit GcvPB [Candidatus Omnitrophota bacterium]MBU1366451.1 aminomethyl-transferring glycine dehydrogenase subunit GcvPB [Candidatus Omnitrophota bacterium]MBU1523788.1 aminomethyl-transferring glycine dehydrogenase subunit GcvPB [Candidatus Omnitrophota bacterium]MBU1810978.1 aminomethyl-transferring glycine dehydrogenase subunit GcvPB
MEERVIFEKGRQGRKTNYIKKLSFPLREPKDLIPQQFLRENLNLSCLGELEVIRHYTNLARRNFSVDANFYPLGSCTMKYNPKINEDLANLEGFLNLHPYQEQNCIQGALEVIRGLEGILCEITGMKRFSFQASSGAQGELVGMLMIKKYHQIKRKKKTRVIIPDSSHGTNPATASMCGYKTLVVESTKGGLIDLNKLSKLVDDETAAIMLTNPNTLGLFEENILKISEIIHRKGGFLYYDGANFNPLLGKTSPSLMGFDVIHLNLHKTFSTPHGCGGPGAGAVGVRDELIDFLPLPLVDYDNNKLYLNYRGKHSIGKVRSFYGNFTVLLKAYIYLLRLGREGLLRAACNCVINANYIREKLKNHYEVVFPKCMHEVVFSCVKQKAKGAGSYDIAKRLIDYGIHPPTMYFPLIVKEALMAEPTETESKQTLDYFIQVMIDIDREISHTPELVKSAPHTMPVKRVDEVRAARFPDLRWKKNGG